MIYDCIIIGAGPGGLVATKELLEQGLEHIICLEKSDQIGGVFSNTYDSLVLTSSCTFSMFSDFWIGDKKQHEFWTKAEVLDYWKAYAQHFQVLNKIRFNTEVIGVEFRPDQIWKIILKSGEELQSQRLVLATGNNQIPRYPDWRSLLTIDSFHSQSYRNAQGLAGKNVLVVGGGESGSDIALEVAQVAKQCWVSLRHSAGWILPRKRGKFAADISTHRGLYGLPRTYGDRLSHFILDRDQQDPDPVNQMAAHLNRSVQAKYKVWGIYGTKNHSLPTAIVHHGCQVVGEITEVLDGGQTLKTKDGKTLEGVDLVIFCTGYQNHIHWLPPELQRIDPRSLYQHMIHPSWGDRLVWIGWARPNYGSQFPIMEMQARYLALLCTQQLDLPSSEVMCSCIQQHKEKNLQQFETLAERVRSLVDYYHYMDSLANLIGCDPPFWRYFILHPGLWFRIVYGATQGTQFRLKGPGQKINLAHEILAKLPVSPFNHVVRAGLWGRFIHTLVGL
jgi:dimethylaniline monooxygenase (N-oxide forming)